MAKKAMGGGTHKMPGGMMMSDAEMQNMMGGKTSSKASAVPKTPAAKGGGKMPAGLAAYWAKKRGK